MHLGDGYLTSQLAGQLRTHRLALVLGTLATVVYTALVWWLCHPIVKQFNHFYRRGNRWRLHIRR
jgi:hypothetical protein